MSVNSPKFHPGQDESPFDPPMPMVNHYNLGPLFKYLTWKGMIQKFAAIKGVSCSENFKVAHGYLGYSIISLTKYTQKLGLWDKTWKEYMLYYIWSFFMEEWIAETKNPVPWGDDVHQTLILLNDIENVEYKQ